MRWGKAVAYAAYASLAVVLASGGFACENTSHGTGGVGPPGPTGVEATPPPPASVTSITPHTGTRGSRVTIRGTGFASAEAVCFGRVSSPGYGVSDSGTRITAVVPPGAGRVQVAVITATGASAGGPGSTFTYRSSATGTGATGSALPASLCTPVPPEASL
jgi:hypothetical protein